MVGENKQDLIIIMEDNINFKAEKDDFYNESRLFAYKKAGLVHTGKDNDGDDEWIGTDAQWERAGELWNELLETLPSEF